MSGSGGILEYQREMTAKLEQLMRERNEARAEVERLRGETARARFQRPLADKRIAEAQREACARVFEGPHSDDVDAWGAGMVRKAPLVTDEEDADEMGELHKAALSRGQP